MRNFYDSLTIERLTYWVVFILLFVIALRPPLDTDVWWHLQSGDYFLQHGEILREDIFSFTQQGQAWINHSWGSQVILTLAYQAGGGEMGQIGYSGTWGLALYTAILGVAGMFLVNQCCVGNVYSRAFVLILGASTAAVFWSPRPQMISFFLSTVVLYLLHRYKRADHNLLWLLPPLMALWVNLHGGFALGFILLFGFIVGEALENLFNPTHPDTLGWRRLGQVVLMTGLSILALSLNPYGPRMMAYPFETAGLQTLNLFIVEWMAPNFKIPQMWPFVGLLFALIFFAAQTKQRLSWGDLVLSLGTALLALWAARNIALFAVVATPALSRLVDAFLSERGWQIRPIRRVRGFKLLLNWTLLAVILFGAAAYGVVSLGRESIEKLQQDSLPLDALDYLQDNPPSGPLLNNYNWGGLLIFSTPDVPVFVDGRTDLYGDSFLADYFKAELGASTWQETLATWDIQTAFLTDESALSNLLRAVGWQPVYADDQAVILVAPMDEE